MSPRPPPGGASTGGPEVDEFTEISPVAGEHHHSLTFRVADDGVTATVAAHSDGTIQRGGAISTSGGRRTCTGSGTVAELGDVTAARIEYLDAAAVGVGDQDSSGSDVRSDAQRRPESEVAWPDRASEMTDLHMVT